MESLVARFAVIFTPIVVATCAGIAFIPMAAGASNKQHWVYLALQILVTACPCALVLSTPVTVVAGLAAAARQGVLIKVLKYVPFIRAIDDISPTVIRGHMSTPSLAPCLLCSLQWHVEPCPGPEGVVESTQNPAL
jgi:predicted ABC-type sugar transport system permease subunit